MPSQQLSLYEILGVQPCASEQELRIAFKRCALMFHPDKGGSKESFQCVLHAFEVLSSSEKRKCYDRHIANVCRNVDLVRPVATPKRSKASTRFGGTTANGNASKARGSCTDSKQHCRGKACEHTPPKKRKVGNSYPEPMFHSTPPEQHSPTPTAPKIQKTSDENAACGAGSSPTLTCTQGTHHDKPACPPSKHQRETTHATPRVFPSPLLKRAGQPEVFKGVPSHSTSSTQVPEPEAKRSPGASSVQPRAVLDTIINDVHRLLQLLTPPVRKIVLTDKFDKQQRIDLEKWMLARRNVPQDATAATSAKHLDGHSNAVLAVSPLVTGDASSAAEVIAISQSGAAESDNVDDEMDAFSDSESSRDGGPLALCDKRGSTNASDRERVGESAIDESLDCVSDELEGSSSETALAFRQCVFFL